MQDRTPPLSTLRLFEAAGRHLSFARAAADLNVTPSAVSHGIVGLEKALGVKLFQREPGRLSLTRDGADYLAYVSEALSLIAVGTRRLSTPHSGRAVRVSCAPTFASRWLVPRLHRFRRLHPRIALTLDTAHRQVGFPADGVDFAIRMSGMSVAAMGWTPLFGEWLVPVCSPACRDAADQARVAPAGTIHVDTIQLALEAALAGLGVALGRTALMERELRDGRLVALGRAVPAETRYWLVASDALARDGDLRAFGDWLRAEAEGFADSHAEWVSTSGAAAVP